MSKKVLFLFANRPFPLHMHFMDVLEKDGFQTSILYMNRKGSSHNVPISGSLCPEQCHSITWAIGSNTISKVFNKLIIVMFFAQKIAGLNFDMVHAWNFEMLLAAIVAKIRRPKMKIAYTLQDTMPWMTKRWLRGFQRWAYNHVSLFFVTSRGFESGLLRRFKLIDAQRQVIYVPNAPLEKFFADFKPRPQILNELVVGCVGTLRGKEGLLALVNAAFAARVSGLNIRVLFAGSGIEQALVEGLAAEHNFVEYLGPYRYNEDIKEIYSKIDVFYAIYDGTYDKRIHFAYRFCEAVCCGLPIITAADTHMGQQTLEHGVGKCVPIGAVDRLSKVLWELAMNPSQRLGYSKNCVAARKECVFEKYIDQISRSYKSITV